MAKEYLEDKATKKKSAVKAVYLLVIFVVLVGIVAIKLSGVTGSGGNLFNGLPSSDQAYNIAKVYIRPTVRSESVDFSDDDYKYAKKSDSVYVIKSSYVEKDGNGEKLSTNFTITLKYNGGHAENESNWTMLDLNAN